MATVSYSAGDCHNKLLSLEWMKMYQNTKSQLCFSFALKLMVVFAFYLATKINEKCT